MTGREPARVRRLPGLALLVAAVVSGALIFSAPTAWSAGGGCCEPQVAFDPAGNALVVWGLGTVQAAFRPANGRFSTPTVLSAPDRTNARPQVAFDPAGNALAVWEGGAAFRPGGGAFSALTDLDTPGGAPQVAFDAAGNALAVGVNGIYVQAAFRPAGGAFSAPSTLAAGSEPQVAFDPAGNALAVWARYNSSSEQASPVQAAFRPAGGAFSAPADLSDVAPTGGYRGYQQVAFDAAGNALAVWERYDGPGTDVTVQAAFRPAGGAFSAPTDLAPGHAAQVAFDPAGNALVIWGGPTVQAAFRPAGGAFSAPIDLGPGGVPQVAFDRAGNALAVWVNRDGIVQAAFRPAGGAFSAATELSARGGAAHDDPQVAFDAAGNALAVWEREYVVQAAFRPAGGAFSAPANLTVTSPVVRPVDKTPPALRRVSLLRRRFAVGSKRTAIIASAKGTTIRYRLSENAAVAFAIERLTDGRKVGGRCQAETRANRRRPRCARATAAGALARGSQAGANKVAFSGRVAKRKLKPGNYRLTLRARDAAGNASTSKTLSFTILAR